VSVVYQQEIERFWFLAEQNNHDWRTATMSQQIFLFQHVSWLRRLLGLSRRERDPGKVFGETTISGYTVLDTDKLVASDNFEEKLNEFARDNLSGHTNSKPSKAI
jgi:hypothetical protein